MSLSYIIDGYNVIKQLPSLLGKPLRDGRDGLIKLLETYRPHGSSRNLVTVVFDGKSEVSFPGQRSLVKVIFSKGESADERIKRIVESAANPKQLIVVTDDKEIKFFVRSFGVRVLSIKEFMSKVPNRLKFLPTSKDKPDLSSQKAQAITRELEKLWLKEGED